ncbi:MAG: threonine synthase [Burkholderiales bacterium]
MRYVSTRGGGTPLGFSEILLAGLAPDGGLYVPEALPKIDRAELAAMRTMPYHELAATILTKFASDIEPETIRALAAKTYTKAAYRTDAITPLTTLAPDLHILQLSNGPTLAFKDMAMQFLGNLFEHVLSERGEALNIFGATSGDTGSSAEYAMRGKRGIRVFMLSPHKRMSRFQAAQMFSLQDPNIFNIAVRGVFDDCQDLVKAISNDLPFKARHRIGTVNSINWARVAAQTVYYFRGYFAATRSNDEQVSFSVPSGNFGNIYAGYLARSMGLPVRKLILATNENNVLDEFFRTGRYRVRSAAEVHQTSSPSMDISKASNFERFVYDIVGQDGARLRELYAPIDRGESFDLAGTPEMDRVRASGFVSGASSHADRLATIKDVYQRYGVIIDTHTADGVRVGLAHREPGVPLVCLETALPIKFSDTILEAIGREAPRPTGFEGIESLPQRFDVMDPDPTAMKAYIAARTGL